MSFGRKSADRGKIFDPAFQKSLTEAIHKENKIRIKWFLEHGDAMKYGIASCSSDDEPGDDDDIAKVEGVSEEDKSKEAAEILSQLGKADPQKIRLPSVMKPVPAKIKKLLYKGLSRNGEGRLNYLKFRYKEAPEDKFFFPVCSSWEYGWTYGQEQELKCPEHGQRQIIKYSFFRPNDPQLKPRA